MKLRPVVLRSGNFLPQNLLNLGCALAVILGLAGAASLHADVLQNGSVSGDAATLNANNFTYFNYGIDASQPLDGSGVNVGVVEADDSFAAAYYGNNAFNALPTPPGSTLLMPNGNPDLPGSQINFVQLGAQVVNGGAVPAGQLPQGGNAFPATAGANPYVIGNHATEVTGVIMGQGNSSSNDLGIAPYSGVTFGALDNQNQGGNNTNKMNNAALTEQQVLNTNPSVVNNSWGFNLGFTQSKNGAAQPLVLTVGPGGVFGTVVSGQPLPAGYQYAVQLQGGNQVTIPVYNTTSQGTLVSGNNGNSLLTEYEDWAATTYNSLIVVSGNEGAQTTSLGAGTNQGFVGNYAIFNPGNNAGVPSAPSINGLEDTPSDGYNVLDVGATGARTNVNAQLNYQQLAPYNTTNMTSDVSAITGYGREKTDLVAPGGDPFNEFSLAPFAAQYLGTLATPPTAGFPENQFTSTAGGVYSSLAADTYANPANPVNVNASTATAFTSASSAPGNTNIVGDTIAGTSFAAPLVSGASALLYQYGGLQNYSTDHRLMKALLMNGAVHQFHNLNGTVTPLTNAQGNPWARLPGSGYTPYFTGTSGANYSNNANPLVRPGLDPNLGTGELNVLNSLTNYAAGQQTPTSVSSQYDNPTGWDVRTVAAGTAANTAPYQYDFTMNQVLGTFGAFQATLCWDDAVNNVVGGVVNNAQGAFSATTSTLIRNAPSVGSQSNNANAPALMTDLDLYLFKLNPNGTLGQNIDYSTSDIDNVEYISSNQLQYGQAYALDVVNAQMNAPADTTYGLAWSVSFVPEPASATIFGLGLLALCRRRVRASAA